MESAENHLQGPSRPVQISGVFQTIISIFFILFVMRGEPTEPLQSHFGWTWVAQNCTNAVRRVTSASDGLQTVANKGLSETGKDR